MDKQFEALRLLGAGDFQHVNRSLEAHLKGTQSILNNWGASEVLQSAGLFHAAYGTAAFNETMVSLTQRERIKHILGDDTETLVYLYCSCDRDYVFPQFGESDDIQFKDRFTGKLFLLPREQTSAFCELFVANKLECIYRSEAFKVEHGLALRELFDGMEEYLSPKARLANKLALREFDLETV